MKIDVSTIPNYETMTPEEKIAALEALDIPEQKEDETTVQKLKNALNKASSDVAEYKKKLKEQAEAHMSEEEKKEAERKEREEQLQKELETLRQEKMIAGYKASYVSMGYEEMLAEETAKALVAGDMEKVFANQKVALEATKQALREESLDKQPPLSKGKTPTPKEIEDQQTARLERMMWGK